MISPKHLIGICVYIFFFFYIGCSSSSGKANDRGKDCDVQIQELTQWLDDFVNYCRVTSCGVQSTFREVVELNEDLPPIDKFLHGFFIHKDYVVDYNRSIAQRSAISASVEKSARKLKISETNLEKNPPPPEKQIRVNLFIDPNAPWELVVQTVQGLAKAFILDINFVFDLKREFVSRPPNTPFERKLNAIRRHAKEITEPDEQMVIIFKELAKYMKGCPRAQEIFREINFADEIEKILMLKAHLPAAIKVCECNPTISHIKSVVWHALWTGKVRASKQIRTALPGSSDCYEVSQDGKLPWKETYKAVMKAAGEQSSKPLCLITK